MPKLINVFTASQVLPIVAILVAFGSVKPALAQAEDSFFGTNVPAGGAQPANPYADPSMPKGDFTSDEKRMQKKFRASLKHARNLISKGEKMMQGSGNKTDSKEYKKGKIFKEIGEKQLAELQANNPLADLMPPSKDGDKKKTAKSDSTVTQ